MSVGVTQKILTAIAAVGVFTVAGCEKPTVKDAAYYVAHPEEIEAELARCSSGATPAEVCQQVRQAKDDIARVKRREAYQAIIARREAREAAQ